MKSTDFIGLSEFIERPSQDLFERHACMPRVFDRNGRRAPISSVDEALQHAMRLLFKQQLCSAWRAVILVSPGAGMLAQLCQRVAWMERGRVRIVGSVVVQAYNLAAYAGADGESWIEEVVDGRNFFADGIRHTSRFWSGWPFG